MLEFGIIILLILLNGIFAMSEMALVSARRPRLQTLAEQGSTGARRALALTEDPGGFLSTVQVGITVIGILAGAYGGATVAEPLAEWLSRFPILADHAEAAAITAVVAMIAYLSLILGELVPKRIAMIGAERIAIVMARPMAVLAAALAPAVWLLRISTEFVLTVLRMRHLERATVTEEEIKTLIAEGTQSGVFHPSERDMMEGVLRLADRSVRVVMTPRPDVVWLEVGDDAQVVRRKLRDSGRSRLPLSRGDIDDIIGVVEAKTLLDRLLGGDAFDLAACAKPPLVVHETMTVLELLEAFRTTSDHFAVVVDEYGSFIGVATVTDLLEAIAGDLPEIGEVDETVVHRADGSILVDGLKAIDDVEKLLGLRDMASAEDDFHTLGGFIMSRLGRVPETGATFLWQGWRFEVVDMDGRRVDKVLISRSDSGGGDTPRS